MEHEHKIPFRSDAVRSRDKWIGFNAQLPWEKDGQIVGVTTAEAKYHVFPNIHPEHECSEMFGEMLAVAEKENAGIARDGKKKLIIWVDAKDTSKHEILQQRGFARMTVPDAREFQNRADLDKKRIHNSNNIRLSAYIFYPGAFPDVCSFLGECEF